MIIKPNVYKKIAYIRDAVKQECDLVGKLTQVIKGNADGQYADIITDSNTEPGDAQVLMVEIKEVLGDFKARRYSDGGMFDGYKGTCAILGRCVKTLGKDVAKWLAHPTSQPALDDL